MNRMIWMVVGVLMLSSSAFAAWTIFSPEDESSIMELDTIVASGVADVNCQGLVSVQKYGGLPDVLAAQGFNTTEETAWNVDLSPPTGGWGDNGDVVRVKLYEVEGESHYYHEERGLNVQAAE